MSLSLGVPEFIVLGAVQHGVILLAYEERASEGSGLCGACSAFLPKVLSGWTEGHCNSVLFIVWDCSQVFTFSYRVCVCCTCRQQKDVALVNMANILHRAHFSADAAILAHAALDLTSDLFTSHYTLGNIYAVSQRETIPLQWRLTL